MKKYYVTFRKGVGFSLYAASISEATIEASKINNDAEITSVSLMYRDIYSDLEEIKTANS